MQSRESRIQRLEQATGQAHQSPNMTLQFIRPEDKFCCGYLQVNTGVELTQRDDESDVASVARAKAAGFEGADHAQS